MTGDYNKVLHTESFRTQDARAKRTTADAQTTYWARRLHDLSDNCGAMRIVSGVSVGILPLHHNTFESQLAVSSGDRRADICEFTQRVYSSFM